MGYFLFKHQFHQLLCRRGHIFKPLSERHYCEAHALEVLHHLNRTPTVKGYLTDIETFAEFLDEFFNKAVMHYITLGCLQITLSFPHIIRNMVTVNTQSQIILGNPEVRQNDVLILIVQRRKSKYERSNIRG